MHYNELHDEIFNKPGQTLSCFSAEAGTSAGNFFYNMDAQDEQDLNRPDFSCLYWLSISSLSPSETFAIQFRVAKVYEQSNFDA